MKKLLLILLVAGFFSDVLAAREPIEIKIISYNIRTITRDGNNSWQYRQHATKNMLQEQNPDAFGLQEAMVAHLRYIDEVCPQYARVGVGRDDGKMGGEIMAIYYKKERFELLDSGTFWLSETPSQVSLGWDASYRRTATWVKLRDKKSGRRLFYFNTHLDHKGQMAQSESIKLIIRKVKEIAGNKTTFITGDFNIEPDNKFILPLSKFANSARTSAKKTDNRGTFNGFGTVDNNLFIDYIFYRGKKVSCPEFCTLDGNYGAPYISDHYPIAATFIIK